MFKCSIAQSLRPLVILLLFLNEPSAENSSADVIQYFADVQGVASGEWGWDDFGTTGSPYAGPHAPDQFGAISSSLNANPGGLITSTRNLYSFFSVPIWNIQLNDLEASQAFTSIAVQFATSSPYTSDQFTLGGQTPTELIDLGPGPVIGGFPVNLYWVQWVGLEASTNFTLSLVGTGQHQSLAGAKVSYFNTPASYHITAVPEPSSAVLLGATFGLMLARRKRRLAFVTSVKTDI